MIDLTQTPQRLKQSILMEAMQGKLTKQLPSDGNADELLQKIQHKKQFLIKAGKIRKHRKLPSINKNNIQFKIPKNWKWSNLDEIGYITSGGTPRKSIDKYWDSNDIPWLTPKYLGLNRNNILLKSSNQYISKSGLVHSSAQIIKKGSIIYSSRAPIGYLNIVDFNYATNQGAKSFTPIYVNPYYVYYMLMARTENIKKRASGTTFKEISGTKFRETLLPVPPLPEQKRIVKRLNEILPKIDGLNKDVVRLHSIRKAFPHRLKQSLLMEAMQGKLTKQLPSDGNADELLQKIQRKKQALIKAGKIRRHKKLPPISKDEIPFKIPKNWKWVRLGSLTLLNSGLSYKKKDLSGNTSDIRIIRGGNISNDGKLLLKNNDYRIGNDAIKNSDVILKQGQLLTPISTSPEHIAKMAIVPKLTSRIAAGGFVYQITPYVKSYIFSKFLLYDLSYVRIKKEILRITHLSGSALCNLPKTKFIKILVPLPPLNEQERIANVIQKCFSLI